MASQTEKLLAAVRRIAESCPRLVQSCYWAGTASISLEELHHRDSFDLDFHTRTALLDVRPILAEIQAVFPGKFRLAQAPDAFGSGFSGALELRGGDRVALEVLSNYEDVPDADLVACVAAPQLKRVSLRRYLADKIQCVAERAEARDLFDILAILTKDPGVMPFARRVVAGQDELLLVERLLAWTGDAIERDLKAYPGVDPNAAKRARDLLLSWIKSNERETTNR